MSEYDFLKIFEAIIDEADVTSGEKEKQEKLDKELDPFDSPRKEKEKLNQENDEESKSERIDVSVEFSDFIKAANALRASHSFNDKDVKGDLNTYFKGLNTGEKQSLYIFFKAITQIAASDVDGDKVDAPHDHGITTSSSSTGSENKEEVKPQEKIDQDKPEEKGSPNPITVGESKQDISDIIAILNEVNKG